MADHDVRRSLNKLNEKMSQSSTTSETKTASWSQEKQEEMKIVLKRKLAFLREELDIDTEQSGEHSRQACNTRNKIGLCLHALGDYNEALEKFEQCLTIEMEVHGKEAKHPDLASSYNNIGTCLKSMGRYNEALEKFEQSATIIDAIVNLESAPAVYMNLGLTYCQATKYAEGLVSFQKASKCLESNPLQKQTLDLCFMFTALCHLKLNYIAKGMEVISSLQNSSSGQRDFLSFLLRAGRFCLKENLPFFASSCFAIALSCIFSS